MKCVYFNSNRGECMCAVRQKQKRMSLERFQSLPVLLILVLAVAGASCSTVWVAPERGKCQGRSPCTTLQHLWHQKTWTDTSGYSFNSRLGVTNISESNTTWIFLPGVHRFPILSWITFQGVNNLVLTGDELCVMKKVQCTIKCNYLCLFLFIESKNITIQHLNVIYRNSSFSRMLGKPFFEIQWKLPYSKGSSCFNFKLSHPWNITGRCSLSDFNLAITSWMFIAVSDVHIHSLHLVGYDSQITVYKPRAQVEVIGSQFSRQLPAPSLDQYIILLDNLNLDRQPSLAIFLLSELNNGTVNVLVSGCTFKTDHYPLIFKTNGISPTFYNHHAVLLKSYRAPIYHAIKVSITIDNCTFLQTLGVNV